MRDFPKTIKLIAFDAREPASLENLNKGVFERRTPTGSGLSFSVKSSLQV